MSMKLADVEEFIAPLTNKKVFVRFCWESEMTTHVKGALAYVIKNRFVKNFYVIVLNRNHWRFLRREAQESILLHELGHIQARKGYTDKVVESEYAAQKWAMRKARELGMYDVYYELRDNFEEWGDFDWNSSYRRYRLAHIRAKRDKVI